jgi:predicted polyphosphate/ATP-dependent NAD kinase
MGRLGPQARVRRTLGIIVNPIAGLGGAAGLKGTDGPEVVAAALARGAVPRSGERAAEALRAAALGPDVAVLAAAGAMGEGPARAAGLSPRVLAGPPDGASRGADTEAAARAMLEAGVDLILLAGGDGTARDVCRAVGEGVPVVGVPAGVKMHSAVHATTPRAAGELVARFLGAGLPLRAAEVMDIDKAAFRAGEVAARLFGYLQVPVHRDLVQGVKAGRVNSDAAALDAIAEAVAERLLPGRLYILGPGTTTRAIARRLGLPKTLLGVDLVRDGVIVGTDVDEAMLLEATRAAPATIIVTPIGGQGHILGRGNQQISPAVVRQVGPENIVVVATPQKLASLAGRPLRVDTGDAALDRTLAGHLRVLTGHRTIAVCPVE